MTDDLSDLVGLPEIQTRLGVKRSTLTLWRSRQWLPAPAITVGNKPLWSWRRIEAWARHTGKLAWEPGHVYDAEGYDITEGAGE